MSDPSTSPAPASNAANPRAALLIVFLVVFIDLLGFGIVLPLLQLIGRVYLLAMLPGSENAVIRGVLLGLLLASFSAMQFIFAPVWGRISDRVGRRPILLLGLAGSVVFYALFGYAAGLEAQFAWLAVVLFFVARLGAGIAGATIATAQAVIADSTVPEKRKHGMALIGAAFGIGFTFGPLIGAACLAFLPEYQGAVGYVAALLSLAALILGLVLLPETRRSGQQTAHRKWFSWRETRAVLAMPTVGLLVLIFFLATLGFGGFEATVGLLSQDVLDIRAEDIEDIMYIFAYVGFVLLLTQGVIYRRLAKRLTEETFIRLGMLGMGLGVVSLGLTTWYAQQVPQPEFETLRNCMLASMTLAVMGFAFLTPSVQALISRRSDPERQGEILGVNQSASALARIFGPFFGAILYNWHPSHMLPYIFGGGLILLMLPLMGRLRQGGEQHGQDAAH